MKTLYLHIGHGKTGSSFIQSVLANNIRKLEEHGILYPLEKADQKAAEKGKVTSGSGGLIAHPDWPRYANLPPNKSILVSFEGLQNRLVRNPERELELWEDWRTTLGCDRISVLLLIRDPIEHAASSFQQSAKSGKLSVDSLSDYFLTYDRPTMVLQALQHLTSSSFISTTTKNYSRCKSSLIEVVCSWLDIPVGTLSNSDTQKQVNRSLTYSELKIVLALSRLSPKLSLRLANRFSNTLPNRESFRAVPSVESQEKMILLQSEAISKVSEFVGLNDRYQTEKILPTSDREAALDEQQRRIIWEMVRERPVKRALPVILGFLNRNKFNFD